VGFLWGQVYDRVKAGDEYQSKLDMLPGRVADCEDAIHKEQAEVEARQAEKAEKVTQAQPLSRWDSHPAIASASCKCCNVCRASIACCHCNHLCCFTETIICWPGLRHGCHSDAALL
jgi:hypothetical protein